MEIRKYINRRNYFRAISKLWYLFDWAPKKTFYSHYKKYRELYLAYKKENHDYSNFVVPMWVMLVEQTEGDFINDFDYSFLKHPVIRRTMFMDYGGTLQKKQLEYLASTLGKSALKSLLNESKVGHPTLTDFTYQTSHNTIHHLSHLIKFSQETHADLKQVKQVVEWGGGYGNLARIFLKINPHVTYIMIDVPVFAFIQATYLSSVCGDEKVHFVTKTHEKIEAGKINIVPLNKKILERFDVGATDIFISTWALSESSHYAQQFVESLSFFNAESLLIAHQEKSKDTPYSEDITNHLKEYRILYHQKVPYLKNNYYLFAEKDKVC